MRIRSKVTGAFLAILILFIALSVYNYANFRSTSAKLTMVNTFYLPFTRLAVQLQGSVFGVAEDMRRYAFPAPGPEQHSSISKMARDLYSYVVNKKFATLESMLAKTDSAEIKPALADFSRSLARVKELFGKLTGAKDRTEFDHIYLDIKDALRTFSQQIDEECNKLTFSVQSDGQWGLMAGVLLAGIIVVLGVFSILFSLKILRPIPDLTASLKKIADGNFNESLKVDASDKEEITALAREYNRMLEALRSRDEKILEQQRDLLQGERLAAVGQLSAEVVHEIRNPLNAISLNIDWLEEQIGEQLGEQADEVKKALRSISREIIRLHEITESYLIRSKVPMDDTPKTEINGLLEDILDFCREEYKARRIAITTEFANQEIFVRTEKSRMRQALLNLLKNAKEAMPRGGELKIATEVRGNTFRISVSDSGYGMNDHSLRQTFRPFFTTKSNGTGLGLTLTKNVVEEALGVIQCESRVGEGTTFNLEFPV